ncbi:MAG TPA: 50S ribosomal protein L32e [Aciduliprofundum sp.]|nr:50S ribosomal protein L32e [Aciduliprofundum sp.]
MMGVKPSLSAEEKRLLELRNRLNRKRPEFRRQEWFRYKRLGEKWRRPRGLHSKMRKRKKYRPPVVEVGYRGPRLVRGLHPSGFREVLVHRPEDLEGLDPSRVAVRIASSVGGRKREKIIARADELGIRVLNRGC